MPRAFRVKEEILQAFPHASITLSPKTGGFFDVVVDGVVIFSKTDKIRTEVERFPEIGEITELLRQASL